MLRANLRIVAANAAPEEDRGDDWGEWDFSSLPRSGDHIQLERQEQDEILVVRRVIHFAAQHPIPRSETPYKQRKTPSICIIASRREL